MVVTDRPTLSVPTDYARLYSSYVPTGYHFYLMPTPYLLISLFTNYMLLVHAPDITPSETERHPEVLEQKSCSNISFCYAIVHLKTESYVTLLLPTLAPQSQARAKGYHPLSRIDVFQGGYSDPLRVFTLEKSDDPCGDRIMDTTKFTFTFIH